MTSSGAMELVEDVGSGIRRIRNALKGYGQEAPLIEVGETWFSLMFKRKAEQDSIEPDRGLRSGSPSGKHPDEGVNEGVQ